MGIYFHGIALKFSGGAKKYGLKGINVLSFEFPSKLHKYAIKVHFFIYAARK